jgi:hypothetical protein
MARSKADETGVESTPALVEAARKRSAAASGDSPVDPKTKQWLDALAAERAGYERRGLTDRIAQVDEQIKRAGG